MSGTYLSPFSIYGRTLGLGLPKIISKYIRRNEVDREINSRNNRETMT